MGWARRCGRRGFYGVPPTDRSPSGAILPLQGLGARGNEATRLVIEREAGCYSLRTEVNRTRLQNLRSVLERGSGEVRFGEAVVEASAVPASRFACTILSM